MLDARPELGAPPDGPSLQGLQNVNEAEDFEWLESGQKSVRYFKHYLYLLCSLTLQYTPFH